MAKVTIERTVEWYDTDAAGHQHHSCIVRFVEAAEAALLREHDLAWLFGETPVSATRSTTDRGCGSAKR